MPVGVLALRWGAIGPEERYLRAKFGSEYDDYLTGYGGGSNRRGSPGW